MKTNLTCSMTGTACICTGVGWLNPAASMFFSICLWRPYSSSICWKVSVGSGTSEPWMWMWCLCRMWLIWNELLGIKQLTKNFQINSTSHHKHILTLARGGGCQRTTRTWQSTCACATIEWASQSSLVSLQPNRLKPTLATRFWLLYNTLSHVALQVVFIFSKKLQMVFFCFWSPSEVHMES